ncbi:MAG: hypothetical protein FJW35_18515 [Acidobacteria bacterium]|nr:hypothetical protein [Acidobacteriota bacterium]
MNTKGRLGWLAIATWMTCTTAAAAETGKKPETGIRFRRTADHRILVPVRIDGKGPFRFVLDTGAAVTVICDKVARKLALRPMTHIRLTHFTGTSDIPLAPIRSLSVGDYSVPDMKVIYCDLQKLWGFDRSAQGVLGQDFLSKFNFLLNWRERTIHFERNGELRSQLAGTALPCERLQGKYYVRVPSATRAGRYLKLLLDSGSPYMLVYETPFTREDLSVVRIEGRTVAQTADGRRELQVWRIAALRLGEVLLEGLRVRIAPPLNREGLDWEGILPVSLFESIYFNSEECYIILNPRRLGRIAT